MVAWDQTNRVLILKSESKTRSNLSNVQIINLEFVTDIQVTIIVDIYVYTWNKSQTTLLRDLQSQTPSPYSLHFPYPLLIFGFEEEPLNMKPLRKFISYIIVEES